MQLVLLCREQDFKRFGHELVLNPLIRDLKNLEDNSITMKDGSVLRGGMCAIAGDNLSSHNIGGFVENSQKFKMQFLNSVFLLTPPLLPVM